MRKLLNNGKTDEVIEIVQELKVSKNGDELSLEEIEDFVKKAEDEIAASSNPEIKKQYDEGLKGSAGSNGVDWTSVIEKSINDLSEAPIGYRFYSRSFLSATFRGFCFLLVYLFNFIELYVQGFENIFICGSCYCGGVN